MQLQTPTLSSSSTRSRPPATCYALPSRGIEIAGEWTASALTIHQYPPSQLHPDDEAYRHARARAPRYRKHDGRTTQSLADVAFADAPMGDRAEMPGEDKHEFGRRRYHPPKALSPWTADL